MLELRSLYRALIEANGVTEFAGDDPPNIGIANAARFEAQACQKNISQFFEKTEKFRQSFTNTRGPGGSGTYIKGAWMKVHFKCLGK